MAKVNSTLITISSVEEFHVRPDSSTACSAVNFFFLNASLEHICFFEGLAHYVVFTLFTRIMKLKLLSQLTFMIKLCMETVCSSIVVV